MIFKLERRGDGWGEEIFPHIVVENRPLDKPTRSRPRSTQPDPWQVTFLNHRLCVRLCLTALPGCNIVSVNATLYPCNRS